MPLALRHFWRGEARRTAGVLARSRRALSHFPSSPPISAISLPIGCYPLIAGLPKLRRIGRLIVSQELNVDLSLSQGDLASKRGARAFRGQHLFRTKSPATSAS